MTPFPEGSRGAGGGRGGRASPSPSCRPCWVALRPSPLPLPAPAPDREAWRKVEAGSVTVVGTASDARLVETAVTLRALVALMPGLVPGAFGAPPPLVAVVVHDAGHLARAGYPPTGPAGGRIVVAATSDEEARAGFLRAVATALARRSRAPLPEWLVAGLGEYLSTFSATGIAGDAGAARAGARGPPSRRAPPGRASGPLLRVDARGGGCGGRPPPRPGLGRRPRPAAGDSRWRRAAPPLRRAPLGRARGGGRLPRRVRRERTGASRTGAKARRRVAAARPGRRRARRRAARRPSPAADPDRGRGSPRRRREGPPVARARRRRPGSAPPAAGPAPGPAPLFDACRAPPSPSGATCRRRSTS